MAADPEPAKTMDEVVDRFATSRTAAKQNTGAAATAADKPKFGTAAWRALYANKK